MVSVWGHRGHGEDRGAGQILLRHGDRPNGLQQPGRHNDPDCCEEAGGGWRVSGFTVHQSRRPGGSGISLVEGAEQSFSKELLAGYDVVGFDPRGVGSSTAIKCGDATLGMEASKEKPQPGEAFETWAAHYLTKVREAREQCEAHSEPGLLDHVNTVSVAKDLDVLRAISGEKSLNYLGFSYGTELGYTYAELFPKNAGRLVLDGAVDSTISHQDFDLDRAEAFENALHSYVQACLEEKPATTVR